jgi:hypothetical protein
MAVVARIMAAASVAKMARRERCEAIGVMIFSLPVELQQEAVQLDGCVLRRGGQGVWDSEAESYSVRC